MYKIVYVRNLWESGKRRAARNDDATTGGLIATQRLGMILLTYMNKYRDSHHSSCQHGECQQLAKHAVMRP